MAGMVARCMPSLYSTLPLRHHLVAPSYRCSTPLSFALAKTARRHGSPYPSYLNYPTRQQRYTITARAEQGKGVGTVKASPSKKAGKPPAAPDERLVQLREVMRGNGGGLPVDAYIVPSEDPHQSEYSADCFNRRGYISHFTGSAGTAVVTAEKAALWTDGRYFLQAEQQLPGGWQLMRAGQPGVPNLNAWLRDSLPPESRVGIDPLLHSVDNYRELSETLAQKGSKAVLLPGNLIDRIWNNRPPLPQAPLRVHPLEFAGVDVPTKLADIRKQLQEAGASALVVSSLDEVAWLFNLRGGDVPHCPVALAYALVEMDSCTLYVDAQKVTPQVEQHLEAAGVRVEPYEDVPLGLQAAAEKGAKVWMDMSRVSVALHAAFDSACSKFYTKKNKKSGNNKKDLKEEGNATDGPAAISRPSPVVAAKAVKNSAELAAMRAAHLRDAAALAGFWAWLEKTVAEGGTPSEVEVGEKLEGFRRQQAGFLDTSFDTIAGSGPNGAVIHYRAEAGSCGVVNQQQLFLLDSGAQYEDGTTDVTRTVHFGTPSQRQKECVTRVLQGHIALDRAVFPENTPGFVLDVLARAPLWSIGLDYRHGTGHGVGAALNVHEGPQGISPRFGNTTGLQAGMIVSNEPGYYEDGAFGIRIENLLAIKEMDTPNRFGGTTFLGFERLTFCPIQTSLLDLSLMSETEIAWLNNYHAQVWEKVSPLVSGEAKDWLQRWTQPVSKAAAASSVAQNAGEAAARSTTSTPSDKDEPVSWLSSELGPLAEAQMKEGADPGLVDFEGWRKLARAWTAIEQAMASAGDNGGSELNLAGIRLATEFRRMVRDTVGKRAEDGEPELDNEGYSAPGSQTVFDDNWLEYQLRLIDGEMMEELVLLEDSPFIRETLELRKAAEQRLRSENANGGLSAMDAVVLRGELERLEGALAQLLRKGTPKRGAGGNTEVLDKKKIAMLRLCQIEDRVRNLLNSPQVPTST